VPACLSPAPLSLDAILFRAVPAKTGDPAVGDDSVCWADLIGDPSMPDPCDVAVRTIREEELAVLVSSLPPREARITGLWLGLGGRPALSMTEIARMDGLSRARIGQLLGRATRRLRLRLEAAERRDRAGEERERDAERRALLAARGAWLAGPRTERFPTWGPPRKELFQPRSLGG
jgi:DNA-binding CsgD family transcriptional regulator